MLEVRKHLLSYGDVFERERLERGVQQGTGFKLMEGTVAESSTHRRVVSKSCGRSLFKVDTN